MLALKWSLERFTLNPVNKPLQLVQMPKWKFLFMTNLLLLPRFRLNEIIVFYI